MPKVKHIALPSDALLLRYRSIQGAHTDCYTAHVQRDVDLKTYATAFFDSWVFRIERRIIALAGGKRSSRDDVEALATGTALSFSEWTVEDRNANQILLAVGDGPIRTWIMRQDAGGGTNLYFGSAILPARGSTPPRIGASFRIFMGVHRLYARILLSVAARYILRATT